VWKIVGRIESEFNAPLSLSQKAAIQKKLGVLATKHFKRIQNPTNGSMNYILWLTKRHFSECPDKDTTTVGEIVGKIEAEFNAPLSLSQKAAIQKKLRVLATKHFKRNHNSTNRGNVNDLHRLAKKFYDGCTSKDTTTVGDIIGKIEAELDVSLSLSQKSVIQKKLGVLAKNLERSQNTTNDSSQSIQGSSDLAIGNHASMHDDNIDEEPSTNNVAAGEYATANGSSASVSASGRSNLATAHMATNTANGIMGEEEQQQREMTQTTQQNSHQQPIKLMIRGQDEAAKEDDQHGDICHCCWTNQAVVASTCCGKRAVCLACTRQLYKGKMVGQKNTRCLSCQAFVEHMLRIS